jgi:hypothetical protein
MILCDFAQEVGGKLYILGGGWSKLYDLGAPMSMALAIKLWVPWNSANQPIALLIELRGEDGESVLNDLGEPIKVTGQFEVGRPPGLRQGSALDSAVAIPIVGLRLKRGGYRWELSIQGQLLETYAFEVVGPPPGFPVSSPPR